jgi:hypothetical protein
MRASPRSDSARPARDDASPDLFGSVLLANKAAVVLFKIPDAYRLLDKPIANFAARTRRSR